MYRSVDVSEYACERYGHECRDIATWKPGAPSDLVVCQGVLQYIANDRVDAAISNLAAATRAVLYLEVPTLHDRDHVVDREYTDMDCHWRSADWYRRRLTPYFQQIGAGVWVQRDAGLAFYELERSR
jgi:trans-aconitate methyltransferase